jgi:hypothetical protein
MSCHIKTHLQCPDCEGEIMAGRFVPVLVRALDADGAELPADPTTGELPMVTVNLPMHVADVPCSRAAWELG